MKKEISILLVLTFIFALTACAPAREKASDAVEKAITAIKEQDSESIEKYFGIENPDDTLNEDEFFAEEEYFGLFVKNLSYEILESNENGDTATVKVSITNLDMGKVISAYISELFNIVIEYAFVPEEEQPTDEEMEKLYVEKFASVMESDIPTVTKTVDVTLTYSDGCWRIGDSKEFIDALLGGIVSYAENMQSLAENR